MQLTLESLLPLIAAVNLVGGLVAYWLPGNTKTEKSVKRVTAIAAGLLAAWLFSALPPWAKEGIVAAWFGSGGASVWKVLKAKAGTEPPKE